MLIKALAFGSNTDCAQQQTPTVARLPLPWKAKHRFVSLAAVKGSFY